MPAVDLVPISLLSEHDVRRMGEIRYQSLPSLAGRSLEQDQESFRRSLRSFLMAAVVRSDGGRVEGFTLVGTHLREWRGRQWMWLHAEDAALDARFRGAHALERMAFRVTAATRIRHPFLPVYGLSLLFPASYLKLRAHGPAWAWGQPGIPEWEAGALEHTLPDLVEDRPVCRERHVVQVSVTTASAAPTRFRTRQHRAWFADYERLAPEWREGRIPVVMYPVSLRSTVGMALRRVLERVLPGT